MDSGESGVRPDNLPTIGSYEQSCIDFALFGDPAREAADYEFNAQFDFWNELREEFYDDAEEYADKVWWEGLTPEERAAHLAEVNAQLQAIEPQTTDDDVPF